MSTRATRLGLAAMLVLLALHLATPEHQSASGQAGDEPTLGPPIGQLGGLTRSIVELPGEDRLLLGNGTRLALVDIQEPLQPRLIERGPMLEGLIESIVVLDRQILVQAGEIIYSLDREAPLGATLGSQRFQLEYDRFGVPRNEFGAWRDRAFVVEGKSVRQFDVGDVGLFHPLPSIQVQSGFEAVDLLAAGGRLYLSTVETMDDFIERPVRRLMVYDIAGTSEPKLLGQHEHSGWGRIAVASPPGPQATVFGLAEGIIGMDLRAVDRPKEVFFDDSSYFRGSEPWNLVVDRSGAPILMHERYGEILRPPSEQGGRWETTTLLGDSMSGGMLTQTTTSTPPYGTAPCT